MSEDSAADVESEAGASQQQHFKRSWVSEKLPEGYRLATFHEVTLHRAELLFSGALETWDISKLLDGWIDGPGYANRPVREYRPDLGTRLLIRKSPDEGRKYEWIKLDEEGQRIAFLFACEVGLKAAEPFLQMFRGNIEAGPEAGISCGPLHAAILGGDFHLCCKLVKAGADVNRALGSREAKPFDDIDRTRKKFSGLTGATPLHLAIAFNFEKIVLECLLMSKDLNLQACDGASRTALHCAALSGNVAIFEALLSSKKIDLGHPDKAGVTALHVAAAAKNSAILDILLKSEDVDFMQCDTAGRSALHVAATSGNVGNVRALIPRMKSAIQQADGSGKIPLVYAIESCEPQVISQLLKYDRRDFQDMGEVDVGQSITLKTPLHYAVYIAEKKVHVDNHSMLKSILEHATSRTREMFDLFWDENAWLYRHAKHVRVQQLLAGYLAKVGSHSKRFSDHCETSIQRAAKAGLVHLIRLLLADQPNLLQELESTSWTERLTPAESGQVLDVKRICYIERMHNSDSSIIEDFCRQATDQPAVDDSLGRRALVEGLATLLLNPFTGTPLTIGIYGEWGHGKSSLMRQVDIGLCTIAIQQAFIHPLKDTQNIITTDHGMKVIGGVAKAVKELVGEDKIKKNSPDLELSNEVILEYFVDNYDPRHHAAYRSLALTDTSELFKPLKHTAADGESSMINQSTDAVHQPRMPAVLTVWYNAWRYQNETEALAGLAVEIIKEMESAMNMALWMCMCWSYAWSKNRREIYTNLFFPVTIVGLLSVLFSSVLWSLLSNSSTLDIYKYSAPPVCFVVLLWTIFVRLYNTVQPVSSKLFSYFNPAQHESKLGYQHQVIADIMFMMTVLRRKQLPTIWRFLAKCKWIWVIFGLQDHDYVAGTRIFKQAPSSDMRIVVLLDDLDRCNDGTILKVLSAINLVLSVCEINVILGIDKSMIHRALKNELFNETNDSSSKEYAQKFLRKIVQLPIALPDPTNKRMGQFLARQMGFVHNTNHNKLQRRTKPFPSFAMTETEDDEESLGMADPNVNKEELNNMLLARYTAQECSIMVYLQGFTEHDQRLPREWKRFLNYHRFACNILSKNAATQTFPDWKIELLVWVFVCWQWMDLMDTIIEDWRKIEALPTRGEEVELEVGSTNGRGVHKEGKIQNGDDKKVGEGSGGDREIYKKIPEEILEEEGESDNELTKQRCLENQDNNNRAPSLLTIAKFFSDELKRGDDNHHQSWQSLLDALGNYDVSMQGIQIFQEFRFNCKHGLLPWPIKRSLKTRDGDEHMRRLMSTIKID